MSAGLTTYLRAMLAIVRRDFAIFMSYRGRLVEQVLAAVGMILIFNFTAKLVHVPQFATRGDYFAFVVVGIVSLQVLTSTLTTPPVAVRQELVAGTFERLVVSPFGPVMSTMSMMIFPVLLTIVMGTFTILLAAIAFGMPITWATAPLAFPVAALSAIAFMPFGIAIAAATLAFKQALNATTYIIAAIGLVAGFYFPITLLPGWVQWTSQVQPFTPAVDLIRNVLVGTPLPHPALLDLAKLAGFAVVLVPVSAFLLSAAVSFGRRRGTITEY
jgi:ABC-2 type transport system permease protein